MLVQKAMMTKNKNSNKIKNNKTYYRYINKIELIKHKNLPFKRLKKKGMPYYWKLFGLIPIFKTIAKQDVYYIRGYTTFLGQSEYKLLNKKKVHIKILEYEIYRQPYIHIKFDNYSGYAEEYRYYDNDDIAEAEFEKICQISGVCGNVLL